MLEDRTAAAPAVPFPPRDPEAHKGHFGLALLIGGSQGMAGAIALAGMAAIRGGAGLVRLAVPETCQATVAAFEPAYMTVGLPASPRGLLRMASYRQADSLARQATAVAIGPGLGRSAGITALVNRLYTSLPVPLVVDADALNALAERPESLREQHLPRVLTPHLGEFARLEGARPQGGDREAAAISLAKRTGAIVVLKGHRTCIASADRVAINSTGNPGMATGGSGDVLTGLITALLCQRLEPFDAACLGVYLHGLAGDLAALEMGQESLAAGDLIRYLPAAFLQYRAAQRLRHS